MKSFTHSQKKLRKNKFDLDDLRDQLQQMKKMGSLESIMGMLPGMGSQVNTDNIDPKQFLRMEAIISSMTKKERRLPGAHMHDPLTVGILIHPAFCRLEEMRVDVQNLLAGIPGWWKPEFGDIAVRAAVDVDVTHFESFLAKRLTSQILSKYRH